MSNSDFSIDDFLSSSVSAESDFDIDSPDLISDGESNSVGWSEPGYTGEIDYRIRQLSYSSILTLHTCPRKFQLNRLRTTHRTEDSIKSTITFAFGHVVGDGIQKVLEGWSTDKIIWKMFLDWHTDLLGVDEKLKKSFWTAVIAIQKFISLRDQGFLNEYELVYVDGRPACELSFSIEFPDGFRLRGFVDAVLQHRDTGEVIVLECKTTGAVTLNPESFKNSAQAIGYSIVLDVLFPELSSYKVLYLVYQTKSLEFNPIPFTKTYKQRALWIQELLLDIEMIKMYDQMGVYPMHGESCFTWGRACEYFNTCTMSTQYLTKPMKEVDSDKAEYQITLTLHDLLEAQLGKVTE